jgi:DNA-nicking Smr family endonuclease
MAGHYIGILSIQTSTMSSKKSSKKSSNDEIELFRREMEGVKPLADDRVILTPPQPAPRRRADTEASASSGFAVREHAAPVDPDEELFFARSGPQHKLLRRLKRGELPVEASLDLHGHTLAAAGDLLANFLQTATGSGFRCVLVVHGKGHRSEAGRPVLKSQVNQWLRDHPAVLAFCSAVPRDGGGGAVYILLQRA